eukprot:TRINITY_DN9501_c1_g1_i4.p1 TRINITY_DN9501_c1_g1~~TRINITY_DN9501_c1_g1_i4.p1  ORF type:complete len:562 (-),score=73.11 TRINITY_DN9501_c1_g1_i4:397-2082(-)
MAYSEDEIVRRAIGQRLEEDARLIDAIVRQDCRQIRQLLQFGVNPNGHPMSVRGPPLHLAAQQGSVKCVQVLIDGGAFIDNPNGPYGPSGFRQVVTPLHVAVKHGNVGMVRLLTALGADIDIPDRDGITVRQLVNNRKDLQTVVQSAIKERQGSWSQASANFSDASRSSLRRGSDNSRYLAARLQLHDSCLSISRCASRSENHRQFSPQQYDSQNTTLKMQRSEDDEFDFVIQSNQNKPLVQKSEKAKYGEFEIQNDGWQEVAGAQKYAQNQKNRFGLKIFGGNRGEVKDSVRMCQVLPYNECRNSSCNDSSSSSMSEFSSFRDGIMRDFNLINNSDFKSIEINPSRNQILERACHQQILQQKQISHQKNIRSSKQTNIQSSKKPLTKKVRPFIPKLDLSKVNTSSDEDEAEAHAVAILDKKQRTPANKEIKLFKKSTNNYSNYDESVLDLNDDFNHAPSNNDISNESDVNFRQSLEFERNQKKSNNLHEKQDFDIFCLDDDNNQVNNSTNYGAYEKGCSAEQGVWTVSEENGASTFRSCRSFTTSSSSTNTNTISFLACA